jgi:Thioesterase-like superfamily
VVGPPVAGLVGPIAVSPDDSRIAFNAADANFVGPGTACTGGEAEGAAIRVINLATGKIRTWETLEMPPAPAGTSVTPHEVSWMADGRTLAVSYVWPTSPSGPQLSMAVAALDTTSGGGSLQAHSHVLWSQPHKCVFCVQEALISPDGKSLTATAIQQTAHGYRTALLRIALPSGQYRVLYESPAQTNSTSAFTQDGSGPGAVGEKLGPQHRHGWFGPSVDLTFHLLGSCRSEWVFAHNLARHAGEGYASAEMALWDFGPDGNDEGRLVAYATQVCFFSFA